MNRIRNIYTVFILGIFLKLAAYASSLFNKIKSFGNRCLKNASDHFTEKDFKLHLRTEVLIETHRDQKEPVLIFMMAMTSKMVESKIKFSSFFLFCMKTNSVHYSQILIVECILN